MSAERFQPSIPDDPARTAPPDDDERDFEREEMDREETAERYDHRLWLEEWRARR